MGERAKRLVYLTIVGLFLAGGLKLILPVFAPFLFGFILACLIEPAVVWSEHHCRWPRWLASGTVLAFALISLGTLLVFFCVQFWLAIRGLLPGLGPAEAYLSHLLTNIEQTPGSFFTKISPALRSAILELARNLLGGLSALVQQAVAGLGRLPGWFLLIFFGIMTAYFFSRDREIFSKLILGVIPVRWKTQSIGVKSEFLRSLTGLVRVQIMLPLITLTLGILSFSLLGFRQAFLLGLILAILDLLPMIGPGAFLLPWAGVLFVYGLWFKGVSLVILFILLMFTREFFETRLLGRRLRLHPLAVMVSIYLGTKLYGLGGFFVGPILLVLLRSLHHAIPGFIADNNLPPASDKPHVYLSGRRYNQRQ